MSKYCIRITQEDDSDEATPIVTPLFYAAIEGPWEFFTESLRGVGDELRRVKWQQEQEKREAIEKAVKQ